MSIKVKRIKSKSFGKSKSQQLEKFIAENDGLVFHEPFFNKIVSETFNTEYFYYEIYMNNELVAICPAHKKRNGLLKIVELKPLYDVPYGGFLINKNKTSFSEPEKLLKPGLFKKIIYSSAPIFIPDNINVTAFCNKETAIIDLLPSVESIWYDSIHSKRRNMIRKAIKSEITVDAYSNEQGLKLFWPILENLHKRINAAHLTFEYYLNLLEYYFKTGNAVIILAKKNSKIISGVIVIGNKYMMHYWKGASLDDCRNIGQGELLQWEAIKWAKSTGTKYYDLCVVEPDYLPQIAKFKLGFTNYIVPFYRFSKASFFYKVVNHIQNLIKHN